MMKKLKRSLMIVDDLGQRGKLAISVKSPSGSNVEELLFTIFDGVSM